MSPGASLLRAAVALAVLGGVGCGAGGDGAGVHDAGPSGFDIDAAPGLRSGRLAAARVARWPDGAREITLRLELASGDDDDLAALSEEVHVRTADGEELRAAARPIALPPGYLAVVIAPVAADARAAQADALRALIAERPAHERIAVLAWGERLEQIVGFTDRPRRLAHAIERVAELPAVAAPAEVEAIATAAGDEVAVVGGDGRRVMRAVLVLGAAVPAELATPALVRGADGADLAAAALAAAAAIDRAAEAHLQIGVCAGFDKTLVGVTVADVDDRLDLALPATLPEARGAGCSPDVVFAERALPRRLDLRFTDEERATYDARVAAQSKDDFALGVSLDGAAPIAATAHLRGQSTLSCGRKSYVVELDGPDRFLFADAAIDQFQLVSMCNDDRYSQTFTAAGLLADRGLWPYATRTVEVRLDGESRGVYLLSERIDDDLVAEDGRVRSVLRRGYGFLEVKWTRLASAAAAIASWTDLEASLAGLDGAGLLARLEKRLDLDGYLDWIALASALENGDYVDELYLTSSDALDADGDVNDYFTPTAWDPDDLFTACHGGGAGAIDDPHGLLYCAEASLDHEIFADPAVYARYVERLEAVLAWLTVKRFDDALERTADEVVPWFADPEVCAASDELSTPARADPALAQQQIRDTLDGLKASYRARRALLLERIADYHAVD
jgi:hypothetical protein